MIEFEFTVTQLTNNVLYIVSSGLSTFHPEISMITSREYLGEDIELFAELQSRIVNDHFHIHDHYLMFNRDGKLTGFVITDPDNSNRLRIVVLNRPFYTESLLKLNELEKSI